MKYLIMFFVLLLAIPMSLAQNPLQPPHYATTLTFASIAYPRVNVRTGPSLDARVASIVILGERYPIARRSRDGEWLLIRIGGSRGWVDADSVIVVNPDGIPQGGRVSPAIIANVNRQVEIAQQTVLARTNLNMRSAPTLQAPVLAVLPYNGRAYPLARDTQGGWLLVNYNGQVGWISMLMIIIPENMNILALPVGS